MIGTICLSGGQYGQPWHVQTQSVVDAGLLCAGLPPEQAMALIGRVFGLCRVAHMAASARAMGLALPTVLDHARMQDEVLQDHALALLVTLPVHLNLPPPAREPVPGVTGPADRAGSGTGVDRL